MQQDTTIGIVSAFISAVTYGSAYVPVKWFHKGDGLYFQWLQSCGFLMVAIVVSMMIDPAPIHLVATLSGVFFSVGNSLTIYIMDGIGMSIGYLLWNTVTCACGWAVARFGLFGNPLQAPKSDFLNILGVAVICLGGACYVGIKHVPTKVRPVPGTKEEKEHFHLEKNITFKRRFISIILTLIVGIMYGNYLTPINYVMHNEPQSSKDVRSYILSFGIGAFFSSTIIFSVYSCLKKNRPEVNPELSFPTILSGILYGVATLTFFMANQHLDQTIAYPILSKTPGIVVSLWGIFLFKEIQGRRDILQMYAGIAITLIGVVLISLSKVEF